MGQAASSQAISQKQIGIILALITSIAGAIAAFLSVLYGGQVTALREDHATAITRLEESYDDRVNDLKSGQAQTAEALELCLSRE